MSNRFMSRILLLSVIGLVVGMAFNTIWAVIFWNNDELFIWHWLAVPLSMLIVIISAIKEFRS